MEWYVLYCLLSESKNGKREASMNPNERRLGEREREGGRGVFDPWWRRPTVGIF